MTDVGHQLVVKIRCSAETEFLRHALSGVVGRSSADDDWEIWHQAACQPCRGPSHLGRVAITPG